MSITGDVYAEQGARILALEAELRAEREKNATAIESLLASIVVLAGRAQHDVILHAETRERRVAEAIALVVDTADHYFAGRLMDAATLPPGWIDTEDGPRRVAP